MIVDEAKFTVGQFHYFDDGKYGLIWRGKLKELPQIGSIFNCGMLQGDVVSVAHCVNCIDFSERDDFVQMTRDARALGFDEEYNANLTESSKVSPTLVQEITIWLEEFAFKQNYSVFEIFDRNPGSRLLSEIQKFDDYCNDVEDGPTFWLRRKLSNSDIVDFQFSGILM